jgi:hypothetical protein
MFIVYNMWVVLEYVANYVDLNIMKLLEVMESVQAMTYIYIYRNFT